MKIKILLKEANNSEKIIKIKEKIKKLLNLSDEKLQEIVMEDYIENNDPTTEEDLNKGLKLIKEAIQDAIEIVAKSLGVSKDDLISDKQDKIIKTPEDEEQTAVRSLEAEEAAKKAEEEAAKKAVEAEEAAKKAEEEKSAKAKKAAAEAEAAKKVAEAEAAKKAAEAEAAKKAAEAEAAKKAAEAEVEKKPKVRIGRKKAPEEAPAPQAPIDTSKVASEEEYLQKKDEIIDEVIKTIIPILVKKIDKFYTISENQF